MRHRFSNRFLLVQQEGFLTRALLTQGLTSLRSAPRLGKGAYYTAFFCLSIGVERFLKLVLVLDYLASHDLAAPKTAWLKQQGGKSGHDLRQLLANVRSVPSTTTPHPLDVVTDSSLEFEILAHLSDFAEASGRYANLEELSSARPVIDPLTKWKLIMERLLDEDVPPSRSAAVRRGAAEIAHALEGSARVIAHDLDKSPMTLEDSFREPWLQELAAPRAVARVFRILWPLKVLLDEVTERTLTIGRRFDTHMPAVPFMWEFFTFISRDAAANLRKKRWP